MDCTKLMETIARRTRHEVMLFYGGPAWEELGDSWVAHSGPRASASGHTAEEALWNLLSELDQLSLTPRAAEPTTRRLPP